MENKNNDFRSKTEREEKINDLPRLDPSNELQGGPEKKLLDNSVTQNNFSGGDLDNPGKKEEGLRKRILDENKNELLGNIANNISAESKEINELVPDNNKNLLRAKKKNKDLTIPIILGIVFMLIIGSVVAYFLFKQEKEDPQQIIKSSMEAMNSVESSAFKGDMNINISSKDKFFNEGGPTSFSMVIKFDGQSDKSDSNNIISSFNVSPEVNVFAEGGNEDFSADFSTMSFGEIGKETIYFKLNDFDLGSAGIMYGEIIIPYKNKWYFLDVKELQEMNGASIEESNFDFEKIMEKITELYLKYEMIKFKSDLGDTEINGQNVYHYQVEIDSETMLDFYVDLIKIMYSEFELSSGNDYYAESSDVFEDIESELEKNRKEILAVLDEIMINMKTEIWIDKENKMIHKINISGNYDQEDLNKITNIFLGKAKAKALDAQIKSNMLHLRTDLEIHYDNNYGSYIGFDPTNLYYYNSENINIVTDDDSYLIWAELATTTDKWCVDSSSVSKSVYGDIKGTLCNASEEPREEAKEYDNLAEEDISKIESDFNLSFEINLSLSNFNKPVALTRPEEAENLIKIMEEMSGGLMGSIVPEAGSGLDSDMDGLSDDVEEIYGTDKNNPDTDGDGYSDGEEVKNGYDPTISGDAKLDYDKLFNTL